MNIELDPVPFEQKSVLRNLMELCEHDYSEFSGDEINEHGLFEYRYLDHYWTEPGRHPFFVRLAGRLAGFALVRTLEAIPTPIYSMSEFFILRKYRRRGVGQEAARRVFDLFAGTWRVHQEAENLPAQAFWRKVIGEYTRDGFEEVREEGWAGPIQEFQSAGNGQAD